MLPQGRGLISLRGGDLEPPTGQQTPHQATPMPAQPYGPPPNPGLVSEQELIRQKSNKKKLIWGLVLLVGPSALFVTVTIISFSSLAFIYKTPMLYDALNMLVHITTVVCVLTWLPGIIIGTILLAKRK